MNSYKCTNCEHVWESQEMPFECPKCHSASIIKMGGDKDLVTTLKKYWWIIVAALLAALVVIIALPKGATRVKVKTDTETGRMEVTLKGKHALEYAVILEQNGYIEQEDSTMAHNPVIFNDLLGDYTLKVIFKGQGNAPRIRKFKSEYTFDRQREDEDETEEDVSTYIPGVDVKDSDIPKTDRPEIVKITPNPLRVKQGGTYKISIDLSPNGCNVKNAAFKIEGGDWQESNVFENLAPGSYKVYVKNIDMPDLVDESMIVLQEGYADKCPSVEEINALLPKVANEDMAAQKKFYDLLGRETKVIGDNFHPTVSTWVDQCLCVEGIRHKVVAIDCNNGKVNSITIKEK